MTDSASVAAQLRKQHPATAGNYEDTVASLGLENDARKAFDETILALLGSGWHGYEAAAGFIKQAPRMIPLLGFPVWLDRGAVAVAFSRVNFEPARAYWDLVEVGLKTPEDLETVLEIEGLGQRVQAQFEFASQLLVQVLVESCRKVERSNDDELKAWVALIDMSAGIDRNTLSSFLKRSSGALTDLELFEISAIDTQSCLDVLEYEIALLEHCSPTVIRQWLGVMRRLSRHSLGLKPLLKAMTLARPTDLESEVLVQLVLQVESLAQCSYIIEASARLPLHDGGICLAWAAHGVDYCQDDDARSRAYFLVESAESTDCLSGLQGLVRFEDKQRVLRLFAHAVSGLIWPINVEEPSMDDPKAGLKAGIADGIAFTRQFDGHNLVVPECVSTFDTAEDNFTFYKLRILHQLGFHSFGALDQLAAIRRFCRTAGRPQLARMLFLLLEAARIDWRWVHALPGTRASFDQMKQLACQTLRAENPEGLTPLQVVALIGLDGLWQSETDGDEMVFERLQTCMAGLRSSEAEVEDTLVAIERVDSVLEAMSLADHRSENPAAYRVVLDLDDAAAHLPPLELDVEVGEVLNEDAAGISLKVNPEGLSLEELHVGDVDSDQSMMMTELDEAPESISESDQEPQTKGGPKVPLPPPMTPTTARSYFYDEWDYQIQDYRRRWCRLFEIRDSEEDADYYRRSVSDHAGLQKQVRRQLSRLKPELLVKVRGVRDGEDLDLERAIDAVIDRRAGHTPSENIYVERHRQGRDVAALFLIDMSASTDDRLPDPNALPPVETIYHDFDWSDEPPVALPEGEKIIDLEKHAVIQMSQALEALGDHYAVCGFSGYGRDQVEYTVCKQFSDPLNERAKAKIGGMKACRSTRMGPAIRHAAMQLVETEARIKALIIISDGYPQDHDYGEHRNDRQYGIHDTMKALVEAKQQGVQSFCLTVDPSGHDYLRTMCPDRQYMVIQDVDQLPQELSKVYRSLTG